VLSSDPMWRARPHAFAFALLLLLTSGGACRLLPERYAINAPMRNLIWGGGVPVASPGVLRRRLKMPDGFSAQTWASDLPNARFLRFTPACDLLVSQPRQGQVTLLRRDRDGDGKPDGRTVLLSGLDRPTWARHP
jgi:hypothetical protein